MEANPYVVSARKIRYSHKGGTALGFAGLCKIQRIIAPVLLATQPCIAMYSRQLGAVACRVASLRHTPLLDLPTLSS